ncbi:hypothetical protein CONPUDRAFT_148089 [Coniophora puteana RWD-64-598 SS2]|uniref:Uncharacterized protein n=1 Tax=Coniophora puteana (strain RWD-64-598) TaxID=741705 RepID=A0A5M3N3M9_CONPW|nr:uncharacterized protein CONPUDRAFT_148089 [Coniophora puteana RWD-64-598 SS2]EIW85958.1 hypothetical protein CONPUDRAFT_148089 [Coniophora puteana RWD-64-598 SS2]
MFPELCILQLVGPNISGHSTLPPCRPCSSALIFAICPSNCKVSAKSLYDEPERKLADNVPFLETPVANFVSTLNLNHSKFDLAAAGGLRTNWHRSHRPRSLTLQAVDYDTGARAPLRLAAAAASTSISSSACRLKLTWLDAESSLELHTIDPDILWPYPSSEPLFAFTSALATCTFSAGLEEISISKLYSDEILFLTNSGQPL